MADETHKQQHANSCGAACLMVAAHELGVPRLPASDGNPFWFDDALVVSNAIESKIYVVTCKNGVGFSDYSMPDGIAKAATRMGLHTTVYMSGCVVPAVLKWKYSDAMANLGQLGVSVEQGTPQLAENERMLVVVAVGGLGLHYVLFRPNKSYMDPAYGTNHQGTLWGMGQMYVMRYVDTGIYIVVRRGEVV